MVKDKRDKLYELFEQTELRKRVRDYFLTRARAQPTKAAKAIGCADGTVINIMKEAVALGFATSYYRGRKLYYCLLKGTKDKLMDRKKRKN